MQIQELPLNMGWPTVQWPNPSPPALNWLMACDTKKAEQEEGTGLKAKQSGILNVADGGVLIALGTWVCKIYYAGCDLHQPRLLSKAILWECQNAAPRCSIHIKSVLFASLTLSKIKNSTECWKDCEHIHSPAATGIQKTNFLLIFQGKVSPEFPGDESRHMCQRVKKAWKVCSRA